MTQSIIPRKLEPVPNESASTIEDIAAGTIENERAAVGALLLVPSSIRRQMLDSCENDDFAETPLRFIVSQVREMADRGLPVDQVTLAGYVASNAKIGAGAPRMKFIGYVADLASEVPVPANGPFYLALVREDNARRIARLAGERLIEIAQDASLRDLKAAVRRTCVTAVKAIVRAESVVG